MPRSLLALAILALSTWGLFTVLEARQPGAGQPPVAEKGLVQERRTLPGLLLDGFVQLPNQWRLRPAGRQVEVGDLPSAIAVHPSGQYLAVLHCGYREHEIMILDAAKGKQKILSRVTVDQAFTGLTFTPDGRKLYASGGEFEVVHEYDFARGLLSGAKQINLAGMGGKGIVGGLSSDAAGREIFACMVIGDKVVRFPVENPENRTVIDIPLPAEKAEAKKDGEKGAPPSPDDGRKTNEAKQKKDAPKTKTQAKPATNPYLAVADKAGKKLYVSLWGAASLAVIDLEKNEVEAYWPTASHPTEMLFAPDGKTLYVSCSNSTQVYVFDTVEGKNIQVINCALYPNAPSGNTPNSLALTPDGEMLFVANADANNIAVFNATDPKEAKPLGFIPAGWYPTSVRYNPVTKQLCVANGKGLSSKANRGGPSPYNSRRTNLNEYIGQILPGTMGFVDVPTPRDMALYTRQAFLCSPLKKDAEVNADNVEEGNPIPRKLGEASPIKRCIYIVKENRTYDQVFGDMPQGNGERELCLFPEKVTPNHHKLAREFVLLDNLYVDGEVSADGHEWTMGAYANDFVEKMWPLSYRGGKGVGYPSEGAWDYIEKGTGGYLWDKAAEAKVPYYTFGEWVNNVGVVDKDGGFPDCEEAVPALAGKFDPRYRGYDLEYPDVKRAERFIAKWKEFETAGDAPRMIVVKLPNDHTTGTRVGKPTPTAMVADNDLALGMIVEAVSKSKFWKETAIFVIEDDTQNGPDHVDAHRSVALVVSPYTKRKHVDSSLYSTTSMLRTMELILGLKPMSQFDAAARPMYASFTGKPDFTPYDRAPAGTDVNAKNVAGAWGAEWSEKANLAKEDQADDLLFSEVIWKSVRGAKSAMPAPVRAAFFKPIPKKDDDDDDDDD